MRTDQQQNQQHMSNTAQPPDIPSDIAAQVARAEWRRGWAVLACVLAGAFLAGVGIVLSHSIAPALVDGLLALGVLVAFPLAAVVALRLGPSWQQRRQHWQLLHWQHEHQLRSR